MDTAPTLPQYGPTQEIDDTPESTTLSMSAGSLRLLQKQLDPDAHDPIEDFTPDVREPGLPSPEPTDYPSYNALQRVAQGTTLTPSAHTTLNTSSVLLGDDGLQLEYEESGSDSDDEDTVDIEAEEAKRSGSGGGASSGSAGSNGRARLGVKGIAPSILADRETLELMDVEVEGTPPGGAEADNEVNGDNGNESADIVESQAGTVDDDMDTQPFFPISKEKGSERENERDRERVMDAADDPQTQSGSLSLMSMGSSMSFSSLEVGRELPAFEAALFDASEQQSQDLRIMPGQGDARAGASSRRPQRELEKEIKSGPTRVIPDSFKPRARATKAKKKKKEGSPPSPSPTALQSSSSFSSSSSSSRGTGATEPAASPDTGPSEWKSVRRRRTVGSDTDSEDDDELIRRATGNYRSVVRQDHSWVPAQEAPDPICIEDSEVQPEDVIVLSQSQPPVIGEDSSVQREGNGGGVHLELPTLQPNSPVFDGKRLPKPVPLSFSESSEILELGTQPPRDVPQHKKAPESGADMFEEEEKDDDASDEGAGLRGTSSPRRGAGRKKAQQSNDDMEEGKGEVASKRTARRRTPSPKRGATGSISKTKERVRKRKRSPELHGSPSGARSKRRKLRDTADNVDVEKADNSKSNSRRRSKRLSQDSEADSEGSTHSKERKKRGRYDSPQTAVPRKKRETNLATMDVDNYASSEDDADSADEQVIQKIKCQKKKGAGGKLSQSSLPSQGPEFLSAEAYGRLRRREHDRGLLQGFCFVVTGFRYPPPEEYDLGFTDCAMLNDQVAKVIRMHGGNIAKTFVPAQHYKKQHPVYSDLSSNIVLTDDQRRTTKYMMGVVHSLPCVHYEWVLGCINQDSVIPYQDFRFASGWSAVLQQDVFTDERPFGNAPDIFLGERYEVVGATDFKWCRLTNPQEHWSCIIRAAGGRAVQRLGWEWEKSGKSFAAIVSEPEPGEYVLQKAAELKVPLVSCEWVVESILVGRVLPYDAHPSFTV